MDERTERLLNKAEQAVDNGDIDAADTYSALAYRHNFLRRQEAKELRRMLEYVNGDDDHV
jgi:hypothetical protein